MDINYGLIFAILIATGLAFLFRYMNKSKVNLNDYLDEVKLALMVTKYAFEDEDVKKLSDICMEVVTKMKEQVSNPDDNTIALAILDLSVKINNQMNVKVDAKLLDIIIRIALKYIK